MTLVDLALKLRPIIEQAMQSVDDHAALDAVNLFPQWQSCVEYALGFKVRYEGKLYKVIQKHTSQTDWTPDVAASLFTEVNEIADGRIDNPIPYNNNMTLEHNKYYIQDDVIYLCTRDTGVPVYHHLSALVGLYVEVV